MARKRRSNPNSSRYFDGTRSQLVVFDYIERHTSDEGREAYLLPDGRWLSGARKTPSSNLLKRKWTKGPPRWVSRENPVACDDLPESPWLYFERPIGTELVSVDLLKPVRARPKGIRNARKFMELACRGERSKRAPIDVSPEGEILDGNSTYAVARGAGWRKIPAIIRAAHGVVVLGFEGLGVRSNPTGPISRSDYPAIFGDTDRDTIPDVDDPHPFQPGDMRSIEEVRLSDEIGELIDIRQSYANVTDQVVQDLEGFRIPGSTVKGRVKTPFSMINKLRRKRLGTLTDVAATMIVVPDYASVKVAAGAVENGFEVIEKNDYYKDPQAGYRALHYIVRVGGVPVEIQVKTDRMLAIAAASHSPYKRGMLNAAEMDRVTNMATKADRGDERAAAEIDALLADSAALGRRFTLESNPRTKRLIRRVQNGG